MWARRASLWAVTAALLALSGGALRASGPSVPSVSRDPLAAEIERCSAILKKSPAADEISADVKKNGEPALDRARQALRDGRRLLALQRLGGARMGIEAAEYLQARPAAQRGRRSLRGGVGARRKDAPAGARELRGDSLRKRPARRCPSAR